MISRTSSRIIQSLFINLLCVSFIPGVFGQEQANREKGKAMQQASGTFQWCDLGTIVDWMEKGGSVAESGEYTVWVKALEGSGCRVTIAGTAFEPTHLKGNDRSYKWEKAGTVKLQANETFPLEVTGVGSGLGKKVVALVLSTKPDANPQRIDEVTLVSPRTMEPPKDRRLWDIRNLNMFYTWPGYPTKEAWQKRARDLKDHIRVSCGLWPEPKRYPLNTQVFERIERDGYSIEKVYFESWPGFFVTGNLYRPLGKKGPFPAIASPHGHWEKGRLANDDRGSVPGRCINFARQGYVIFSYDMVGYVDSKQLTHDHWDARAHLWGVSNMSIQTWNSIRALDFLESLEDVDKDRIGCTGASGGGTQTFILTALEDRLKVVAPVNMISAHMQGGCTCENAPNLRVDAYNVEIGSLAAPRPLMMVCCTGDWTDETPFNEFPATQSIYRLFNAENRVDFHQVDADHNYNQESREAVYAWFGKWLLGEDDPAKFKEQPFTVEKDEDLQVFARRPLPHTGMNWQILTDLIVRESKQQLADLWPGNSTDLKEWKKKMGPAFRHAIGAEKSAPSDIDIQRTGRSKRDGYTIHSFLAGRKGKEERIPVLLYYPATRAELSSVKHPATLLVHPEGKRHFADLSEGNPGPLISALLEKKHIVVTMDPFLCGEYQTPWGETSRDQSDKFFSVYNHTDLSCRIQDILITIALAEAWGNVDSINLVGLGEAGLWCLLARGLAPDVRSLMVEMGDVDLDADATWLGDLYIPLIRKVGDYRTAAALGAPGRLFLLAGGAKTDFPEISALYAGVNAEQNIQIDRTAPSIAVDHIAWLTE